MHVFVSDEVLNELRLMSTNISLKLTINITKTIFLDIGFHCFCLNNIRQKRKFKIQLFRIALFLKGDKLKKVL